VIVVHLDFEASGVTELRKVGADVWTRRKDTYPTVLSFAINDDPVDTLVFDSRNHHRSTARVKERLAIVRDPGTELHAWNAGFEFMVWNNICVPRFNWPAIPIDRFHCTMARAACAGLPMSLEQASEAAQTGHVKDMVGARNMKRMAKPRRADPTEWWHLCQDDLAQTNLDALIEYNRADVEAERAIHQMTPRMTQEERRIWLVDQKMQAAGLPIDAEFLEKLAALTEQELAWLNFRLDVNTASQVTSFTQHKRLLDWLQARGYQLSTLGKDAVPAQPGIQAASGAGAGSASASKRSGEDQRRQAQRHPRVCADRRIVPTSVAVRRRSQNLALGREGAANPEFPPAPV